MAIFIDTEIWVFAQKAPDSSKFSSKEEFKRALKFHEQASEFLKQRINDSKVYMTNHQLCEIFHALAFRGMKLSRSFVSKYCNHLLTSKFMHWYQVSESHVKKALECSVKSGIHIWDYLCVIPLCKDVKIIYSCDGHFKHETFQSLGPKIENPLYDWISL